MIGQLITESLAKVDALHPVTREADRRVVDITFFHRVMYVLLHDERWRLRQRTLMLKASHSPPQS
jgi:hypothetical protein